MVFSDTSDGTIDKEISVGIGKATGAFAIQSAQQNMEAQEQMYCYQNSYISCCSSHHLNILVLKHKHGNQFRVIPSILLAENFKSRLN